MDEEVISMEHYSMVKIAKETLDNIIEEAISMAEEKTLLSAIKSAAKINVLIDSYMKMSAEILGVNLDSMINIFESTKRELLWKGKNGK